jgi:uncharacterized membrane protein
LLLLLITLLAAGLRFYQIGNQGLWLDEAFSVWLGWQPVTEMWAWLLKVDQHPPLYYTLLHFWMTFGDSAANVRSFSALVSTLTVPVIYLLGRRLGGAPVGLLAALLLAISPFHVRFAQETRMYTLLTLNAGLALTFLVYLLTDARAATAALGSQLVRFYQTWRELPVREIATDLAWLGYMIFTAATVFTHNTAILFPISVNLFVLSFILWRRLRTPNLQSFGYVQDRSAICNLQSASLQPPSLSNWLLAQLGAFLLWSPWLGAYVSQALGVYREFWIPQPTFGTVAEAVKSFLSAFLPRQTGWADVIWAAYGLAALLGCIRFRREPARLALLFMLFLVPLAGELLVSLRRPIFYDRTLIWTTIPLFILLAAGLSQLRYWRYIFVGVAILATVNGLSLREYYLYFTKEQWNDAARYVAEKVQHQDVIIFNATWVQIPFDFYFRHYNRPVAEHGAPVDLFDRGILEPKMAESDLPRLRSLIRGRQRVWLVYSHNWYTDPQSLIPAALAEELSLLEQQRFVGLEVRLYSVE